MSNPLQHDSVNSSYLEVNEPSLNRKKEMVIIHPAVISIYFIRCVEYFIRSSSILSMNRERFQEKSGTIVLLERVGGLLHFCRRKRIL